MAFTDKTSRTTEAGYTPGLIPDYPRAPASLLDAVPGFDKLQEDTQEWWETVKASIYDTQSKVGIDIARNGASIRELATITEGIDGSIEGRYTLTVIAGDIVTGMELVSTSGPSTTVSSVTFQADRFKIYSGAADQVMFEADAGQNKVRMGGVLTVDSTNGALYIKSTSGAGSWNDANTPFYVDDAGDFSLRDKLVWDDSLDLLVINGSIYSEDGIIGGFTLGPTSLTAGTGSTYIELSNSAGTGIKLGDTSGPNLLLQRSTGGTTGVYFFETNNTTLRASLQVTSGGYGQLFLADTSGNSQFEVDTGAFFTGVTLGGDTNLYRGAANRLQTDDALRLGGQFTTPDGSTGAPAWSFTSDTDTGWRWNSSGDMRAVTNGADRFVVRDAAIVCLVDLKLANNYVGGAPAATGYVTLQDASGTTYKLLCGT